MNKGIHCLHYLLPGNKLLNEPVFRDFFNNLKYKYFYLSTNHICIHILDSIHYKVLTGEIDMSLYDKYIKLTEQKEHSVENYNKLISNFNIDKLKPIKVYKKNVENNMLTIISDGCHRLSILYFNNIPDKEKYLTMN